MFLMTGLSQLEFPSVCAQEKRNCIAEKRLVYGYIEIHYKRHDNQ